MRSSFVIFLMCVPAIAYAQQEAAPAPVAEAPPSVAAVEAAPAPACEQGIYLLRNPEDAASAEQIAMVLTDGRKVGGLGAFMLTGGLAGGLKVKTIVKGPAAPVRLTATNPVFRFCFDLPEQSAAEDDGTGTAYVGGRRSAVSPRDYTLVRFETKNKKNRELAVSKTSLAGVAGAVSDSAIRVRITEVSAGVFNVTPMAALQPGEYGFIRPVGGGAIAVPATGNAMEQVFGFGIDAAKTGG